MKKELYNQEHDPMLEQIKQKLAHHTVPVDDSLWQGIAQGLKPKKSVVPIWLYVSLAVAAGLALLLTVGSLFIFKADEDMNAETTAQNIVDTEHETDQNIDAFQEIDIDKFQGIEETVIDHQTPSPKAKSPALIIQQVDKSVLLAESKNNEEIAVTEVVIADAEDPVDQVMTELDLAQNETEDGKSAPLPEKIVIADASESPVKLKKLTQLPQAETADWTQNIQKKKKRKLMFAAAFGSGVGSSSATIIPRSKSYRNQSLADVQTTAGRVLTPNDFIQKDYMPPVSSELNLRMPFSDNFALESGLVYNYLQTRLSGSITGGDNKASVDLHYLGVPANLVASLLDRNHWQIYVSAGTMLEKGLRSDFRQYQDVDHTRVRTVASTEVNGLQWSLNSAIGVGYSIHENVSLFFDPKLAYYFDNDQPYSIRKELPIIFSLNAGLRMSL